MKSHECAFTVCLTHDVDRIRKTYQYITHDLRHWKIKKLLYAFKKPDPYWNFDIIINMEREFNVRSTFFFLNETIKPNLFILKSLLLAFGRYSFDEIAIKEIIKTLDDGGWEIGLHGSYNSYINKSLMKEEKEALESILKKPVMGIRQHHLNLTIPDTWKIQKSLGFLYDATFGLKRSIGFRNEVFEPFIHKESNLLIIPLALMDGNLFLKAGNDTAKAWELAVNLIDKAEKKKGMLSILWHQRVFNDLDFPGYKYVYQKIIAECQRRGARFLTCLQVSEEYLAEHRDKI